MTQSPPALPHWDLDVFFPGLDSQAFQGEFEGIVEAIGELEALYDRYGVGADRAGDQPAAAAFLSGSKPCRATCTA